MNRLIASNETEQIILKLPPKQNYQTEKSCHLSFSSRLKYCQPTGHTLSNKCVGTIAIGMYKPVSVPKEFRQQSAGNYCVGLQIILDFSYRGLDLHLENVDTQSLCPDLSTMNQRKKALCSISSTTINVVDKISKSQNCFFCLFVFFLFIYICTVSETEPSFNKSSISIC